MIKVYHSKRESEVNRKVLGCWDQGNRQSYPNLPLRPIYGQLHLYNTS